MENLDIAISASERWHERHAEREARKEKIKDGKIVEIESPRRVQLRLDRLTEAFHKSDRNRSVLANYRAIPNIEAKRLLEDYSIERVIKKNDFLDTSFLEIGLAVARFVGRINILSPAGRVMGHGTGFMVSPRLLMTNNHVLHNADEAKFCKVEFDYQYDRNGKMLPVAIFALDPDTFFMTNAKLDFALVAVKEVAEGGQLLERYGWSRLIPSEGKALLGDSLNIIQHPNGEPKQVVLRSNELVDLFDQYAHYVTDTERGSSGAAVFNDQWELVALHHSGVPGRDENGNLLDTDGNIWKKGMKPEKLSYVANEGIRVSSLVEYIRTQELSPAKGRLREQLLNLEPPSAVETAVIAAYSASHAAPVGPGTFSRSTASASFTVPLTISVQIGASPAVQYSLPAAAPGNTGRGSERDNLAQTELREALASFENAKNRVYYDKEADEADRESYYGSFQPDANRREAYTALSALLTKTHATRLSYSPSKHVYPWVDLHDTSAELTLRSIYSGKSFSPEELIERDYEIMRQREHLLETMMQSGILGAESTPAIEDFLEDSLPYNCEHVVPQSWFSKKEPMRGDLHHLFACESGCNSFRGNIPFFDFDDYEEVVRTACGKREEGKFEPGAGKGTVARATLYFLLRYPGEINRTSKEYTADRIDLLLQWHEQYPPETYERHRNAAIFELQGNRNPLIDYPEWASEIGFELGLG